MRFSKILLSLTFLLIVSKHSVKSAYKVRLSSNYTLAWEVVDHYSVSFSAFVRTAGWVGFGLNDKPKMDGADLIILGVKNDRPYMHTYHAVGHKLIEQETSHWEIGYGTFFENTNINSTFTLVNFVRPLDSGIHDAINVEDKDLYLLWAYGDEDNVKMKHVERGFVQINLINPNPNTTYKHEDTHSDIQRYRQVLFGSGKTWLPE